MRLAGARASLLTLAASLISCGSGSGTPTTSGGRFVGTVDGTDAFIAIVASADHAVAYVCDGTEARVSVATWFDGPASAGALDLTADGLHLTAKIGASASGSVTLPDGAHAFTATVASGSAGLYRDDTTDGDLIGGWILLADGRSRGAVRLRTETTLTTVSSPIVSTNGTISSSTVSVSLTGTAVTTPVLTPPPHPEAGIVLPDAGATSDSGADAAKAVAADGGTDGGACVPATTCNGHGTCGANGACTCNQGFAGANCNSCATGFFGFPSCAACSAATTCNDHGSCNSTGACVCNSGFTGPSCSSCAPGFFGPSCTFCDAATTCNGHGSCSTAGACVCNQGFAGVGCNSCAPGFFDFPACTFCDAATTCSGHGTCGTTGACACNQGFAGASCNTCAPGFFGPSCTLCDAATTCSGHGTCNASGACVCNQGFTGPSCT
jgi:hypothetical protein